MTAIIYYQHYGIIKNYRKSTEDYEKQELKLKNSIDHSAENSEMKYTKPTCITKI